MTKIWAYESKERQANGRDFIFRMYFTSLDKALNRFTYAIRPFNFKLNKLSENHYFGFGDNSEGEWSVITINEETVY